MLGELRRMIVQEEIPPQVEEVEQVPQGDQVPFLGGGNDVPVVAPELSNSNNREAFLDLARAVTTQVNMSIFPRVNVVESTMTSRLRDFMRMDPSTFLVSKVGEHPQYFLDGVYKVLSAMGVTSREKEKLASYQLRDVSQVWYTQ